MINTKRALVVLFSTTFLLSAGACRTEVDDKPAAEVSEAVELEEPAIQLTSVDVIPDESRIDWAAAKVTRQHDGGFGTFDGSVSFDGDSPHKIEFTIDTTSIWSDTERLTGHLKTPDFFDVENFPVARFESTSITPTDPDGSGNYEITGNLEMRGKTNSVTFPAIVDLSGDTIRATSEFTIDRQLWGVSYKGSPDNLIRDDVLIKLDLRFPNPLFAGESSDVATGADDGGSDAAATIEI